MMIEGLRWQASPFAPPDAARVCEPLPMALARAVDLWRDRPAVLVGEACFTFADLGSRAAGLAEEIGRAAVPPGPIALVQSIGFDAVAAWFACALSGRAFVLLEPAHPTERLRELITAAGASLALCDPATAGKAPCDLPGGRLISDGRLSTLRFEAMLGADDPAMIFPTSGSTGTPKLVTYSSRTLQAKVQASIPLMKATTGARVLIAGSHGNYGFLHHALVFLLSGGTLCLADIRGDGFTGLMDAIHRFNVRHVRFTPSTFRAIAQLPEARRALSRLEGVRFSGEPLLSSDLDLARTVLSPQCLIQNVYGSTESALFIWTHGAGTDAIAGAVPIGHIYPMSSYALAPLDDAHLHGAQWDHAPADVDTGELMIRSDIHALGDWTAGAIDTKRFPPDADGGPQRTYATGDIVRRLPDGSLVLLGRANRMAKIRGQRVFLAEVENHLRAMPGVTGAAVVERAEANGGSLLGFITTSNTDVTQDAARAWLVRRLPDFMAPRRVAIVDEIPLLAGGKVDHSALLSMARGDFDGASTSLTQGGDYGRLERIWRKTLGGGAHDTQNDFFSLGGDSLKLLELTLAIERDFARTLSVDAFLANPTLQGLAGLLGVAAPSLYAQAKEGLHLRLVRGAQSPSKGVALAMPGWRGSAHVAPFMEADFFPNHDVWAADFGLPSGHMLEEGRWWRSTLDIVEHVRNGLQPAPRVLFGYSIGGSIAWLVARLLAGTPQVPEMVVMVDAAPMHRIGDYRNADIRRALASVSAEKPPRVLHIQRASLAPIGIVLPEERIWRPEDGVTASIDVAALDHLEMGRADVLRQVADWVAVLEAGDEGPSALADAAGSETGLIYKLLVSGDARQRPELDGLVAGLSNATLTSCLGPLLYLILRDGTKEQARAFLERAVACHPGSRLMRYAARRLERVPQALCPGAHPMSSLLSITAIERALAAHSDPTAVGASIFKRVYQAMDVLRAAVDAAPARRQEPSRP